MENPLLLPILNLPSLGSLDIVVPPLTEDSPLSIVEPQDDVYLDFVTFYETQFWLRNCLPTKLEVKNRFSLSQRDYELYYDQAKEPLKNRLGIVLPDLSSPVKNLRPEDHLDPIFVAACSAICDTADKRTTAAKLKLLGMTTKQWQAQLTLPAQAEYFQKRLDHAFGSTEIAAKLSLSKNVEAGDLQSIKYYHEFTGKYRPQNDQMLNVVFLLGRLMEVLSKHVTPEILALIADEVDTVLEIESADSPSS